MIYRTIYTAGPIQKRRSIVMQIEKCGLYTFILNIVNLTAAKPNSCQHVWTPNGWVLYKTEMFSKTCDFFWQGC